MQTASEVRSSDVFVSPTVVIVGLAALFILALVALLRAPPEDIKIIVSAIIRWLTK
jgi:hypothetical protein